MKARQTISKLAAAILVTGLASTAMAQQELNRTVLPIFEPEPPTYSELDVRNTKAPPRFEVKAPAETPNESPDGYRN